MGAGNITVSANGNVLTVVPPSGAQILGQALYRYANLGLPYSPNDPGLIYQYQNTIAAPSVVLAARFFSLIDEYSPPLFFNVGVGQAGVSGGTLPECLDVRTFGAVGDGVTNDTAAIQAALDTANLNYLTIQSALSQGQPIPPGVGSTIVCIPAGFVFAVGDGFWRSTCGLNWPNNPTTGCPTDANLFVRSGVTVQLNGTVLVIPDANQFVGARTGGFAFYDNNIANGTVTGASITGNGTIDGQFSLYPPLSTNGAGIGMLVIADQGGGFTISGQLTIQNFFGIGCAILNPNNPAAQLNQGVVGLGGYTPTMVVPATPSVQTATVAGLTLASNGAGAAAGTFNGGGILASGLGITLSNINVSNSFGTFGIYVSGYNQIIQNCNINNWHGNDAAIYVDACLICKITGCNLSGRVQFGNTSAGIQTRATQVQQSSGSLAGQQINWVDTLTIIGNTVTNFQTGIQFQTGGTLTHVTPWYRFTVTGNTVTGSGDVGISFDSLAGPLWVNCVVTNNNVYNNTNGNYRLGNNGIDTIPQGGIPGLSLFEPQQFTQTIQNGVTRNFGPIVETPTGTVNGANKTFVISHVPNPAASLIMFSDGVQVGYTVGGGGTSITVSVAPANTILAQYNF